MPAKREIRIALTAALAILLAGSTATLRPEESREVMTVQAAGETDSKLTCHWSLGAWVCR